MSVKGYYYQERGQSFMVADSVRKAVDKAIAHGLPVETGGHTLYPIFADPTAEELRAGKTRKPAWHIRNGHTPTLRWFWQVKEHHKADISCKRLGDGLCGIRMVRFYEWNESTRAWELMPMVNHADSQQEKVLDSSY